VLTRASFASTSAVLKIPPPSFSKGPLKKIIIQIKLYVCPLSLIVHFKYKPPAIFVFLFFARMYSLKAVHPLKIYQHIKCHGPTLSGAIFASPQKFERQTFWNGYSYNIKIWH
jgi:hypothetical protein